MQHEGNPAVETSGATRAPVPVTTAWRAVVLVALLAPIACRSLQRAKPTKSGFLGDYSALHEVDGEAEPELFYTDVGVDWSSYSKVLLEPVTMWRGKEDQIQVSPKDAQTLVNNFHKLVYASLAKDFDLVQEPGPDTLRVEVAITRVTDAVEVFNFVTSFEPHTHLIGSLEEYAGEKPPFTGEAQIELRVTDSVSGAKLMESVDRRVGRRQLTGSWNSWRSVDNALEFWAQQLRFLLCRQQGKSDCEPPVEAKGF